jgi:hypothetical protein
MYCPERRVHYCWGNITRIPPNDLATKTTTETTTRILSTRHLRPGATRQRLRASSRPDHNRFRSSCKPLADLGCHWVRSLWPWRGVVLTEVTLKRRCTYRPSVIYLINFSLSLSLSLSPLHLIKLLIQDRFPSYERASVFFSFKEQVVWDQPGSGGGGGGGGRKAAVLPSFSVSLVLCVAAHRERASIDRHLGSSSSSG